MALSETGSPARSLLRAPRGAAGPPAAPGVRQVAGHPAGLGSDISDSYWQAEQRGVFVPRRIVERLREAHLTQIDDLKRFHTEAVEARTWDSRYRNVLRTLERSNDAMGKIAEEHRLVADEMEQSGSVKDTLKRDIESLKREIADIERISPGLMKRMAEDDEWRKALVRDAAPKARLRLRPVRQAWARRADEAPEASLVNLAQPDPWVRVDDSELATSTKATRAPVRAEYSDLATYTKDQPGVLSSVSDIEATRRGLNSIVERLRSLDPLEAPAAPKAQARSASSTSPAGEQQQQQQQPAVAVQQLRDSEESARRSQAEVRQLRLELQAARGGERAARSEAEQVRQALSGELREARMQMHAGVRREEVDGLQDKIREQDQTIKTLTMQLAAIHSNWADDIEKMHQKYQMQLATARAKSPPPGRGGGKGYSTLPSTSTSA